MVNVEPGATIGKDRVTRHDLVLYEKLNEIDPESRILILSTREGGLVECFVPFDLIDNEEVPVKEEYAHALAKQFKDLSEKEGGTGQHTAIMLGLIEGEPKLKIMDGFHRSAGLRLRGSNELFATIKVTDWDGLFDYRIFTAKDHAHVRFSRVVQWIQEIWSRQELSSRISAQQAVLLYQYDLPGSRFDLTPEEVEQAKAWVAIKEKQWDMAAMTIHGHLKVAESVDPRLVHSTREKKSGHTLEHPTQAILRVFAKEIPDRFDLQQFVMTRAMTVRRPSADGSRSLTSQEIRSICQSIKGCDGLEEAEAVLDAIDWGAWEPTFSATKNKALRRAADPRFKGALVLKSSAAEIKKIHERIDLILQRGEPVDEDMKVKIQEAITEAREVIGSLGNLTLRLADLIEATVVVDTPRQEVMPPEASIVEPVTKKEPKKKAQPTKPPAVKADAKRSVSNKQKTSPQKRDVTSAKSSREGNKFGSDRPNRVFSPTRGIDGLRRSVSSGDISDRLGSYMKNGRDIPEITTRSHVRQAEALLNSLPGGEVNSSRAKKLREAIEDAREQFTKR